MERFSYYVEMQPEDAAVISDDATYTYRELARRIFATAEALSEIGIGSGDRVVLFRERDIDAVVSIMALLLCGATYIPVDMRNPGSRLKALICEADPAWIVVGESATRLAAQTLDDQRVVATSMIDEFVALRLPAVTDQAIGAAFSPASQPSRDTLAYIIFTSGSTGTPKGVPITHANLGQLLTAWDEVMLGATGDSTPSSMRVNNHRSLLLSSLSFDASVAELFWPLTSGGTLVVAPDPTKAAFELPVGALIVRHGVTHLQCTPTRATVMLSDEEDRTALGTLSHLIIGGEALPTTLARQLLMTGIGRITNAYGPTEATVWATTCEVTPEIVAESPSIVPVGRSLRGVSATVIASDGRPTCVGDVGELVVGGPFTSSGYFRNPELSAKSFGTFDFDGDILPGYRTGDLVSRRANGLLDFHGRIDHQVKIRGHRIELGEIEAVLATDATVSHAAVCLDPNRPSELVAFVVANDGHHIDPTDLGNRMRRALPDVMIPRRYVIVRALPTTTSEKIDRAQLARQLMRPDHDPSTDEARDALSEMLADFGVVLNRPSVDPDDDFFELGGHSLSSVELVVRVEERTGVRLPIRSILKAPTPRHLASVVEESLIERRSEGENSQDYENLLVQFNRPSEKESSRKLYLVHGAAGNVLRFRGVARAVKDIVEIVGIQAAGLEGSEKPDASLAAMVMRYADAIEKDNLGPTVELGGYSFGGLVALHLAAELSYRGKSIRSLTLLDSFDSNALPPSPYGKLRALIENSFRREGLPILAFLHGAREGWVRRAEWDRAGTEAAMAIGYHDLFDHIVGLLKDVTPPPLNDAPALLVRSTVESPLRKRTYEQARNIPRTTQQAWIHTKHDELFTGSSLKGLNHAIREFLASC